MATISGNDGIIKVGTSAVAEVQNWDITETAATIRDTAMGDTWETRKTGLKSWTGNITCHLDDTDTSGQEALTVGAEVTLALYPEGDTTGDEEYTGSAIITSVNSSGSFDNTTVQRSFSFEGNGELTKTSAT
jgi:hypothetical protein